MKYKAKLRGKRKRHLASIHDIGVSLKHIMVEILLLVKPIFVAKISSKILSLFKLRWGGE